MATSHVTPARSDGRTTATAPATSARGEAWTGWSGFTAITLVIVASITFIEGLIGVIRDQYYLVVGNQVIVFDLRTWGWIMIVWGVVLAFAGMSVAARRSWARWFTIVAVSLNMIAQLGYLGSTQYPLWTLAVLGLQSAILYGLTARWGE